MGVNLSTENDLEFNDEKHAVLGLNISKTLDKGQFEFRIFNNVNIHVKKHSIYGLLGASGCGKTTLLKCLLGLLPIDQGQVWVLGGSPNTKDSGVPGYQVGYMPQDISLLPEHTVKGAVQYFGGLAGKTRDQVNAKYAFFEEMVSLPKSNLRIRTLSGGDQRKVSLVCALIHEPELIILDEPTAGVEPKISARIWDYLKQITSVEHKSSVIITTHYIEACNKADRIGILRDTQITIEASPEELLMRTQKESLEEAFILLSSVEDWGMLEMPVWLTEPPKEPEPSTMEAPPQSIAMFGHTRPKHYRRLRFENLCFKNITRLIQRPTASLFAFVIPLIIISMLFLAMEGQVCEGQFAVFNDDIENEVSQTRSGNVPMNNKHVNKRHTGSKFRQNTTKYLIRNRTLYNDSTADQYAGAVIVSNKTCDDFELDQGPLSCVFLSNLKSKHPEFKFKYYQNFSILIKEVVETGKYLGYILIPANYTPVIVDKFKPPGIVGASKVVQPVWIALDMTNREIGLKLQAALFKFETDIWVKYGQLLNPTVDSRYYRLPISVKFEGSEPMRTVDFVVPGVMLVMTFFLHSGLTSATIILERNSGLWERNSVLGVTNGEIVLSFLLVMSFFALINSLIIIGTVYYLYNVPCEGNLILVFAFVFLQSINGEVFGFLCSVFAKSITQVNFINLGFYYPFIHLNGVVISPKAMHPIIRTIGYLFPLTYSIQAVQNIEAKGYGLFDLTVVLGFVSTLIWIGIFCLMILALLTARQLRK
ncbi:hypothetical protein WDU94_007596 [Cyamophila willieti]